MDDPRFNIIKNDAKYRKIPKKDKKFNVDNRFRSMFKDKKFKEEFRIDERGRPVKNSSHLNLKQYYNLSSSEGSSSESDEENELEVGTKKLKGIGEVENVSPVISENDLKEKHISDNKMSSDVQKKLKNLGVDYARGEQNLFSESSSDDEGDEEPENLSEEESIDHKWGEIGAEAETTEQITHRLAVCNMNWDRIRALDIMILLNSFLPTDGTIESVKIYTSEFGKKRLAEEDISGPQELVDTKLDDESGELEEGSKYHMEKLRQYQLNRLKYYYAVATFSDSETANKIYTECDGMEYESSSTKIDLRFIPDDMEFDEEPKEICKEMPNMDKYQPRFFVTTALQQSKVNLTWDETNPDRIEITQKLNAGRVEELDEGILQNYLALSDEVESTDEGEDLDLGKDEKPIDKYKALLLDIEEKEREKQNKDIQMEVTWGIELEKKSEELIKKKLAEKQEVTPFQEYLNKRKEKRKEKKKQKQANKNTPHEIDSDIPSDVDLSDPYFTEEFNSSEFSMKKNKVKILDNDKNEEDKKKQAELELLLMNNEIDDKNHFSLKKIQENSNSNKKSKKNKRKGNKQDDVNLGDNFKVNVEDARFSAIYSSHHYNIDPSDPHYKKTEGMEELIREKLKRRRDEDGELASKKNKVESLRRNNAELKVLVKSVKRKTEAMNKN